MSRWAGLVGRVGLVGLLGGCNGSLSSQVDDGLFRRWGRTLLSHPETLTLKEIHLGSGAYTGRDVISAGKVVQWSEHGTYAVISDDEARMLVVLTELGGDAAGVASGEAKFVRVLGTLERGRKGLPVLRAHALSVRDAATRLGLDGKA